MFFIATGYPKLFFQEFVSTEITSAYRMYKCGLFDCDGAWGTSYEFSFHLLDRKHFESFATEILKMPLRDVTALTDSELQVCAARASKFFLELCYIYKDL